MRLSIVSQFVPLLLLAATSFHQIHAQAVPTPQTFGNIRSDDGTHLEELRGFWRAIGYGMIAEISEKDIRIYNECSAGIWEIDLEGEEVELFYRKVDGERYQFTVHRMINPYNMERIEMPDKVISKDDLKKPDTIFELFAATMSDYFAFFELRGIDWQQRVTTARKKISSGMSEEELFNVFESMLKGFGDAHTRLNAVIDEKPRSVRTGQSSVYKAFLKMHEDENIKSSFEEFISPKSKTLLDSVMNETLGGKGTVSAERIRWGRIGDVGYMMVTGMGGYVEDEEAGIEENLKMLHQTLDQILKELGDTKAMIVDVSVNGGGMDLYGQAIACHFADKRRLGLSKHPKELPQFQWDVFVSPDPYEVGAATEPTKITTWTKPVYVVTSNMSVSAAETFVMYMKCLPHVTTVGQSTRGALSDVLQTELPNGWVLGLSNEIYLNHEGKCFEGTGVAPDIELPVFELSLTGMSSEKAIEEVVKIAKKK